VDRLFTPTASDFKEIGYEAEDWIHVAPLRELANTAITLPVPQQAGMFATWRVPVDLSRRNLLYGVCPFLTCHIVSFHLKQVESASAAKARAAKSWLKPR
jgi:hypothetical protein